MECTSKMRLTKQTSAQVLQTHHASRHSKLHLHPCCPTGCGVDIEVLPYLEIMGGSDAKGYTASSSLKEEGGQGEGSGISFEKQGSLITQAWSKPAEDDSDCEAEAVGYSQDVERRLKTHIQQSGMNSGGEDTQFEETSGDQESEGVKPTPVEPDCTHQLEAQSADMLCSTVSIIPIWCHHTDAFNSIPFRVLKQLTPEERAQETRGDVSDCELAMHALAAETLQPVQHRLLVDPPQINRDVDDLCPALIDGSVNIDREVVELELQPTARGTGRKSTLIKPEQAGKQVSAIERERTMRNLVDMQRKVEQRQQRDRERQLLRVRRTGVM